MGRVGIRMLALIPALVLCAITLSTRDAVAQRQSWLGGELRANQSDGKFGFGYGRYEIKLKPSTGQGSITGFFNLCFGNDCHTFTCAGCASHFEVDVLEFTPTPAGDIGRRPWIETCLKNNGCTISNETKSSAPKTNDGSLKTVSFNSFSPDNQVYNYIDFNPYADYHTYSAEVMPTGVVWSVDGKRVLSRVPDNTLGMRTTPSNYKNFDTLLRAGKVQMIVNLWDGTPGFGGPGDTDRTRGQAAQVQKVAFYPLTNTACTNNCKIAAQPSFLADFDAKQFKRDNKKIDINKNTDSDQICPVTSNRDVCSQGGRALFCNIRNFTDQPVFTDPRNVTCNYDSGLTLLFGPPR
jgi:beta-glucanase (GH16 family)